MRKELWSPEEDEKLKQYILKHGYHSWSEVSKKTGLRRCGKSCRLRWINYLRPGLRRCKFSDHEMKMVMDLHTIYGNRWSKIASYMEGRTDNDVKNMWNSQIRRCHLTKLNSNGNNILMLKKKLPVYSENVANLNKYSSIQEKIELQEGLVPNYQVPNMRLRNFPFSLDQMPTNVADNHGIDGEHEECISEQPTEKLLSFKLNLKQMPSMDVKENSHIERTLNLEVDQESSISHTTTPDELAIKRSNYSCESSSFTSTNGDHDQDDKNLNHMSNSWTCYNNQDHIDSLMDHIGTLKTIYMANDDEEIGTINSLQYQIPPIPIPIPELSPSYLDYYEIFQDHYCEEFI